jgi:hypothetical protein
MLVDVMTDFKNAMERVRQGLEELRPSVRPFVIIPLWTLLAVSIAWDVKRYLSGNPQDLATAVPYYLTVIGVLVFDLVVERRLRQRRSSDSSPPS